MTRASRAEGQWWKIGCLGCGGLLFVVVLAAGAIFAIARLQVRGEQIEQQVFEPELGPERTPSELGAPIGTAGRVKLELANADFEIEPAAPGESLRVEARFDSRNYELEEWQEETGEGSWQYGVRFRRTGSSLLSTVRELLGGSRPEVKIFLPPDAPLELELELEQGGARVELGGLWLKKAEIRFSQGGFELSIDEPLRAPMESLVIDGSMGGFSAGRIGNASPRLLDVSCSMGGMHLDLRGPWQDDAEIRIESSMGGAAVQLPRDVRIEGLAGASPRVEGSSELEPPTLRFDTSASMGEIEFLE